MWIRELVGLMVGLAGCSTLLGYGNDPVLVGVDSGGGSDTGGRSDTGSTPWSFLTSP
jgi:hypothetical protein